MRKKTGPLHFAIWTLVYAFIVIGKTGNLCAAPASLEEIEQAVLRDEFDQARNLAEEYLQEDIPPVERRQTLYFLGISQLRLGLYDTARQTFRHVLGSPDKDVLSQKAFIGVIDTFILEGSYQQAVRDAGLFLETFPTTDYRPLVYLKCARAYLKTAEWMTAEKYLKRIVEEYPESLEAFTARQLMREKHFFTVQVGAFLEQRRAEKLMKELRQKGEYAYIVEAEDKEGRRFFRVRVGEFIELEDAEKMQIKLTRQGYPTRIYP